MEHTKTLKYEQEIPGILGAMAELNQVIEAGGVDGPLLHLVKLRASQINRCGFCVKMHVKEARLDGETNDRLDRVAVWDQVNDFSGRERAALAWTEALTDIDPKTNLEPLRARLRENFTDQEIGVLTSTIAMINLWNRINISRH